jgi:Ca2+-binding EF-hand superfamily protein
VDARTRSKELLILRGALKPGLTLSHLLTGNTTLTYDLELLDVRKPAPHHDMFSYMDKNGDGKLTREEVSNYMRIQAEARFAPVHDERWQQEHDKMVNSVFEQEDLDEDGIISHEEFSGPKIAKRSHDEF